MTCIAYRNGVIAADSCYSAGQSIVISPTLKIAARAGWLCGVSGFTTFCQSFLGWFSAGMQGDPPKILESDKDSITGMTVSPDGLVSVYDFGGKHDLQVEYYAIGSGRAEALGAMFAGAGPERAVEAAIAHDAYCRWPVQALAAHEQ